MLQKSCCRLSSAPERYCKNEHHITILHEHMFMLFGGSAKPKIMLWPGRHKEFYEEPISIAGAWDGQSMNQKPAISSSNYQPILLSI